MQNRTFSPGFRLSKVDIVVLVAGTIGAIALALIVPWLAFVISFVLGHFFLFCNIIRMARALELIWAGIFVLLAGATVSFDAPGWLLTACVSSMATLVLVAIQMRRLSYHGVGWQWINPNLPTWWAAKPCCRREFDRENL
ncbi:MAG TPA: hypothetical protein VFE62_04935 [Gemmataceae bacterium]|nr:hypothetical protein [Gemmataceae bacterium]